MNDPKQNQPKEKEDQKQDEYAESIKEILDRIGQLEKQAKHQQQEEKGQCANCLLQQQNARQTDVCVQIGDLAAKFGQFEAAYQEFVTKVDEVKKKINANVVGSMNSIQTKVSELEDQQRKLVKSIEEQMGKVLIAQRAFLGRIDELEGQQKAMKQQQNKTMEKYGQPNLSASNATFSRIFVSPDTYPLHWASMNGQLELCKSLVEKGAQVNRQTTEGGFTPLHFACFKGHLQIVKFLVSKGARSGRTPLFIACREGHLQIVKLLVETGGADIELVDFNGDTVLMAAVGEQKIDIVRYLVSKGARIDRANNEEYSPLHCAANCGQLELCQLLVEKGAQVNQKTKDGRTPLRVACYNGHLQIVKFLVETGGANIEIADSDGNSPLMIAKIHNHFGIVRYLQEKGARD